MQVLRDLKQCAALETGHAVTIGTYDGVHIGHKAVIETTQQIAERKSLKTAVVTFHPHPAMVLRPETAPLILTDIDQKLDLLEACGVDTVLVVPFDETRAQESAEEFVNNILVKILNI